MVSTLTGEGSETALKALDIGAVDVIGKPSARAEDLKQSVDEIITKVRAAACARVGTKAPRQEVQEIVIESSAVPSTYKPQDKKQVSDHGVGNLDELLPKSIRTIPTSRPQIIAIGSSTGGPQALQEILTKLTPVCPGIVVTQHMAVGFVPMFVNRLDKICSVKVVEATDNMPIENGHVYIAPTQKHLTVEYTSQKYICKILEGSAISRHVPSVDVLFRSIANTSSKNALGIILTGMGNDGARCLKEIKDAGGMTIAQDEATSVVFGMPRIAAELGGVNKVLPLNKISTEITNYCK
jgi:two-component system chemotaxis response regulator CheB